jgi:protein-L-isoaspartate(D-aspartate) O-methyltransferase
MAARPEQDAARQTMIERQIRARGIRSATVVRAMQCVPREAFVPAHLTELAYQDTPLPIEEGQTISQPYMVALMLEALDLCRGSHVLEVGTGSGYAAAVLSHLAEKVYTVERHASLAHAARARLDSLGYQNVHVIEGDGTVGYADGAPYDGIVVAAGGPLVPALLREQLAPGGALVMPVGPQRGVQRLLRIRRTGPNEYAEEMLASVRFVPLIGAQGWREVGTPQRAALRRARTLPERVAAVAEPFLSVDDLRLDALVERIGAAKLVLLGEATHGSAEFYRLRARISAHLIERCGFDFVALEADWPDAARIDRFVRKGDVTPESWTASARFPAWMWRNQEMQAFVDWLHGHNRARDRETRTALYGLDLYSMSASIQAVIEYLTEADPDAAAIARARYQHLLPWRNDPAHYGQAVLAGECDACKEHVSVVTGELRARQESLADRDAESYFDAMQNARLVQSAERYYRLIYQGSVASWNLRDCHMFQTVEQALAHHGPDARGIVWAHNSHVGDARHTAMTKRGEYNLGQLCRERFGSGVFIVGFGTHTGAVAAASRWGDAMQLIPIRPSAADSFERVCHDTGLENFMLPLRALPLDLRQSLSEPRLQRAIGVVYRPDQERSSHYFTASLTGQFDELIWIDETRPVTPLDAELLRDAADTYPFGL